MLRAWMKAENAWLASWRQSSQPGSLPNTTVESEFRQRLPQYLTQSDGLKKSCNGSMSGGRRSSDNQFSF
jgi:hypothetical protein